MSAIGDTFGRQVGPLSVGGWIGVGVAGLALGLVARKFMGGGDEPKLVALPELQGPETGGPTGAIGVTDGAVVTPVNPGPAITTNIEWMRQAITLLIADGQDPVLSQQALALFITGEPMSVQLANLVRRALQLAGTPPEYVAPLQITDAGPSTAPTTPPPPPTPGVSSSGYGWMTNRYLIETANNNSSDRAQTDRLVSEMIRRMQLPASHSQYLDRDDPAWSKTGTQRAAPLADRLPIWWQVLKRMFG